MGDKPKISRRAFLTGAAVAVPLAAIALAVPATLSQRPGVAMWWGTLSQTSETSRATLYVRVPRGTAATILLDSTSFPVHSLRLLSTDASWSAFFDKDAPFQLLTAGDDLPDQVASFQLDIRRLTSDAAAGTVQAVCSAADGSQLAASTLPLSKPFFTRFS